MQFLKSFTSSRRSFSSEAPIRILKTVQQVREWRQERRALQQQVGFVATMGALHDGHLDLVRASLATCDTTIVSIFVNPAQFAPTEDLAAYPRTFERDMQLLAQLTKSDGSRAVSAVFLPAVSTLYPSGIEQEVSKQTGTFVEVKGLSHQMEGGSRPTFFRGVATVVMKLFNIVQPDWTYFGQKDIQQCFVLRRMLEDTHMPYPPSPRHMVIVPTHRHHPSGLAMSSRNAYLSSEELAFAPTLYQSLKQAEVEFLRQRNSGRMSSTSDLRQIALDHITAQSEKARARGVFLKADYIAFNEPKSLTNLEEIDPKQGFILSGAMWCGKTRLIDNMVLNYNLNAC